MVKAVCDVCEHAEGSVYCFQESAVMCRDCDHRYCQHPWVIVFLRAFGPVSMDQGSRSQRPWSNWRLSTTTCIYVQSAQRQQDGQSA